MYNAALRLVAFSSAVACAAAAAVAEDDPPRRDSKPRLLRKIEFGKYGSKYVRLGDLNGDGRVDVLLVQGTATDDQGRFDENRLRITCLTALDLEGNVLWQTGEPDLRNLAFFSDYPVQIHDVDGDGRAEIAVASSENA